MPTINGTNNADNLLGVIVSSNQIFGLDGSDKLYGGNRDDILDGGKGDDFLSGGPGNDTYIVAAGDGIDTINDYDTTLNNQDTLQFKDLMSTTPFTLERKENDLLFNMGITDQVLIKDYFAKENSIELITFKDNVTWNFSEIISRVVTNGTTGDDILPGYSGITNQIYGLSGDDQIFGGEANDKLYGGTGDDIVFGGGGDDTLAGGTGRDILVGEQGDDIYYVESRTDYVFDSQGNDSVFISANFVKKPSSVENITYVDGALPIPYWIDALTFYSAIYLAAERARLPVVYFGFPDAPLQRTSADTGFSVIPEHHRTFIRSFFSQLSQVIDLQFVETTDNAKLENNATIIFTGAELPATVAADANNRVRVNNTLDLLFPNRPVPSHVYVHEIGHALGLKHPFSTGDAIGNIGEGPYLPDAENNSGWSVMAYARSESVETEYSFFDLAALHYLYGVSTQANAGDSIYTILKNTPNIIWDGSGTDTLSAANIADNVTLSLEPGTWGFAGTKAATISAPGQVTINIGSDIENLLGGSGNDSLSGNTLANRIFGNDGNDQIKGGPGDDILDGGPGIDVAVYSGVRASYTVTATSTGYLIAGITDGADNLSNIEFARFDDQEISLPTADTTAPSTISINPAANATGVNVDANIVITFNEAVVAGSGLINLKTGSGALIESYDVAKDSNIGFSNTTLTINPAVNLSGQTVYKLEFQPGVIKDLANNSHAGLNNYSFTTRAVGQTLVGTDGDDLLFGSVESDQIDGLAGNDTITGGGGDDTLNGSGGLDFAMYARNQNQYQLSVGQDGKITVKSNGDDGTDTLGSIERLIFNDKGIAFDLASAAGITAKILGAVFGADAVGNALYAGIGIDLIDHGMEYVQLMALAINANLGANPANGQVVDLLYKNVVGVLPDDVTRAAYVSLLDSGAFSVGTLGVLAADTSYNLVNINLVGLAQTGLEYIPIL